MAGAAAVDRRRGGLRASGTVAVAASVGGAATAATGCALGKCGSCTPADRAKASAATSAGLSLTTPLVAGAVCTGAAIGCGSGTGVATDLFGVLLHGLLELGGALGRAARPFAQAFDFARLGEVQQCENGQTEKRGDPDVGAVLVDLVLERKREQHHGAEQESLGGRLRRAVRGSFDDCRPTTCKLGHSGGQPGGIALGDEQRDLVEDVLDPRRIDDRPGRAHDLRRGRRLGPLVAVEQLFVQLLARCAAR